MAIRGPLSFFVLAVVACGDGKSHDPVAEDDLVPEIADVVCDLQVQCECEPMRTAEACHSALAQLLMMYVVPAMEAGLSYDASCGGESVGIYRDVGCGAIEDVFDEDQCRPCKLYYGTKGVGQACSQLDDQIYDDCAQGLLCDGEICADPCDRKGEGEPCIGHACEAGLTCVITENGAGQTSACTRPAKLGQSCVDVWCEDDLVCDEMGKCAVAPKIGEPCTSVCADGAWCDYADLEAPVCRAAKGEGEPCTVSEECRSGLCNPAAMTCFSESFVCTVGV